TRINVSLARICRCHLRVSGKDVGGNIEIELFPAKFSSNRQLYVVASKSKHVAIGLGTQAANLGARLLTLKSSDTCQCRRIRIRSITKRIERSSRIRVCESLIKLRSIHGI